jgi:hypothetical protein
MDALDLRAPAEVFAPSRVRSDLTEQRLREFRPEIRGPVKALARRHRNLADLAVSFPAALFALAHPRKGFDPEPAIRAVVAGEPLDVVAGFAGTPRWLRHVEPRLLTAGLPALADSPFLRRTIVNHLPRKAKHAAFWFATVSAAARDGTEEFAVWCARQLSHGREKDLTKRLHLLALWAWYSAHPDTRGYALIEQAFDPSVTLKGAIVRAERWQLELELHLYLAGCAVDDPWFTAATVEGYDFVPLRTEGEIRAEAQAMQNCLRTYGYSIASGGTRLWSIRRDGTRVATLSAKRTPQRFVCIAEVKAAQNKPAPDEVLHAVQRWFFTQAQWQVPPRNGKLPRITWSHDSWRVLWRPYWLAKRRIPQWLPLTPSRNAFARL